VRYQPTLSVHCVRHPDFIEGARFGSALFARLFSDPEDLGSHGLRIPIRVWRSAAAPERFQDAERCAVVVLLDDAALEDREWLDEVGAIAEQLRDKDLLLPVAVSSAAPGVRSPITDFNFIRLYEFAPELQLPVFLNRVTHALCRMLSDRREEPVKVFLSHAKTDGLPIARSVRRFLQDGSGVDDFFDAQDILEGQRWKDVIRAAAADRNVLLAIRTDGYATREWCRTEVLDAKRGGSAIVVLDALRKMEARGFPYLGNAPSVRWYRGNTRLAMEELLGVLLMQALRFRHFPVRVQDICRLYGLAPPAHILSAPPELLTVLPTRIVGAGRERLVYPDPPLGTEELKLVAELAPELEPLTPTALVAGR
jgi:hypothetical protein